MNRGRKITNFWFDEARHIPEEVWQILKGRSPEAEQSFATDLYQFGVAIYNQDGNRIDPADFYKPPPTEVEDPSKTLPTWP